MSTASSSSTDLRAPTSPQPTRRRRGASEYLSLLHLDQGRQASQREQGRPCVTDSNTGSRLLAGLIIPPFFSFPKSSTAREPLQPRSFLGALLDRFSLSRPTEVVHISRGGEGEDGGKRRDEWEEREEAQAFLDSFLVDCLKKDSSVYTPEEKLKMKRIQETLAREKEEEVEREKARHQGEGKGRNRKRQQEVKEQQVRGENDQGTKPIKKTEYPEKVEKDDEGSLLTLASELSREHPLFGRTFREKIRIYTKSGTEVHFNGGNNAGDARRQSRSSTSETDSTSSEEESRKPGRSAELGDVEVEMSQSMIRESREILHKLQIDQAKEIQLNKMIIEENKRTLKKLQGQKTRKKRSSSPQKGKPSSRRCRMVQEEKLFPEADSVDINKTKNTRIDKHVLNDLESNETTKACKDGETNEKVTGNENMKGAVNGSDLQQVTKKEDSYEKNNIHQVVKKKGTDDDYCKERSSQKKSTRKHAKQESEDDCQYTKVEVVYRNKNFLNIAKDGAPQKLTEHIPVKATANSAVRVKKGESRSHLREKKYVETHTDPDRPCKTSARNRSDKDVGLKEKCIFDSEVVKRKLQEISESDSSSSTELERSHREMANKGVQCEKMKTKIMEIPVQDFDSSRTTIEIKREGIVEKDYGTRCVTVSRPSRAVADGDSRSPRKGDLKKNADDAAKPGRVPGQTQDAFSIVENRTRAMEREPEKRVSDPHRSLDKGDDCIRKCKHIKDDRNNVEVEKGGGSGFADKRSSKQRAKEETNEPHLGAMEGDHHVAPVLGYAITRQRRSRRRKKHSSENSTTSDSFLILCDGRTSRFGCVHNRLKVRQSTRSESTTSGGDSEEEEVDMPEPETLDWREGRRRTGRDAVVKKTRDLRYRRQQHLQAKNETVPKPSISNKVGKKKYNEHIIRPEDDENVKDVAYSYCEEISVPNTMKQSYHREECNKINQTHKDYHGVSHIVGKSELEEPPELRSRKSYPSLMKKYPSYKHLSQGKDVTKRSSEKTNYKSEEFGVDKMIVSSKGNSLHGKCPKAKSSKHNVVSGGEVEQTRGDKREELLDMLRSVHDKAEKLGRVRRVMEVIEERTDLDEREKSHLLADMMVAVERQNGVEEAGPTTKQEVDVFASEGTPWDGVRLTDAQDKDAIPAGTLEHACVSSPRVREATTGEQMREVKHTTKTMTKYQKHFTKHSGTPSHKAQVYVAEERDSVKQGNNKDLQSEEVDVLGGEIQAFGTFNFERQPNEVVVSRVSVSVNGVEDVTSIQLENKQSRKEMTRSGKHGLHRGSKEMEEHMARVVEEYLNKKREYESLKREVEDGWSDQAEECRLSHSSRRDIDQDSTRALVQSIDCAFHKPKTRIEKKHKFHHSFEEGDYDDNDVEFMKQEVQDCNVKQSKNLLSNVQSDDDNIIDSKAEANYNCLKEVCNVGSKLETHNSKKELSSSIECARLKHVLARDRRDYENIMSVSHKNVKPLEFAGNGIEDSNDATHQYEDGATERVSNNHNDQNLTHPSQEPHCNVQERTLALNDELVDCNICSVPAEIPCVGTFEHGFPNICDCSQQSPLNADKSHHTANQQTVPYKTSLHANNPRCHSGQQAIHGYKTENTDSRFDGTSKNGEEATHTANVSSAKIFEVQGDAKGDCQTQNSNDDGEEVLELMTHEGIRTSGYGGSATVVSRMDSPDKVMQEIFKKMDDVIVNRFLTLASINGITIVVTPKLIVNEDSQEGRGLKQDNESEEVVKTEDPVACKNCLSNRKTYNIVELDEKEDSSAPEVNQNKPEAVIDCQTEFSASKKMSGNNNCAGDKTRSRTDERQCEPEGPDLSRCKKSRLEMVPSSSFNKKDVFFISRTFCKSTGAISKEKKLQMRLRRGRATRTRNRSWKSCEPAQQAPAKPRDDQQVVSQATRRPNLMPEDLRILEEITFINVPDMKLKNYDRCYEELLNCSSTEEQHTESGNCMQDGRVLPGAAGDEGRDKREEKPVDSFLEKVRKSLDKEELRMLEESSRTSSLGASSGKELKVIYSRGRDQPSNTTVSTTTSQIRTIEDIISEADNEDRRLSICECFGVTNINDLLASLRASGKAGGRSGAGGRVRGMKSEPATAVKGEVPVRSASDTTVTPELVSTTTSTSLPPPGPVKKPSGQQHRRYQDKNINQWMRDNAMFSRQGEYWNFKAKTESASHVVGLSLRAWNGLIIVVDVISKAAHVHQLTSQKQDLTNTRDVGVNLIPALHKDAFKNLNHLTELDLFDNQIDHLPGLIFQSLESLRYLRLNKNRLVELSEKLLLRLRNLETIDLSSNVLQGLPEGIFHVSSRLNVIHLSGNSLSGLPESLFQGLELLEELDVSDNHLEMLHPGSFAGLTSLKRLQLQGNRIQSLPAEIFQDLRELETLSLRKNQLSQLEPGLFSGLSRLKMLELTGNRLAKLDATDFLQTTALRELHLEQNYLESLPEGVFSANTALEKLFLFNNNLEWLESGALEGLGNMTSLLLNNNLLRGYGDKVFMHAPRLMKLQLDSNKFQFLPAGSLDSLENLESVKLAKNPWHCDCSILYLASWLREKRHLVWDSNPTCRGPGDLGGRPIEVMTFEDLCEGQWLSLINLSPRLPIESGDHNH